MLALFAPLFLRSPLLIADLCELELETPATVQEG
jgi:hypothetical protein